MSDRTTSQELIYQGRILKVYRVGVRTEGGATVQRDLVRYPGAAVILPVLDDGRIVLIRNYRFAVNEHLLELPAGNLDAGEDPAVCAARELTEETGYTAAVIEQLGSFCAAPGSTDEVLHAFLATGLLHGPQALEDHEEIAVEVVTQATARQMVLDGRIHDAKSIATLALYWFRATGE